MGMSRKTQGNKKKTHTQSVCVVNNSCAPRGNRNVAVLTVCCVKTTKNSLNSKLKNRRK